MPRDQDEDDARPGTPPPPPPRAVPVNRPPAAAARPADPAGGFPWGACGVLHQAGELLAFPGARGVIRYVNSGVEFTRPPAGPDWRPVPAEPGRYELRWADDPAKARSFATIRADLDAAARAKAIESAKHPLLAELDAVSVNLAELAAKLHAKGWSVGLASPDSVIVRPGPDGPEPVPVDLGFRWKGSYGLPPWEDAPGRPAWIDADAKWAGLYDRPPVKQQFAAPVGDVYPPADPAADVKTLGRLVAYLVTGRVYAELPAVAGPKRPYWDVLTDAVAGRFATSEEFADALKESPPSRHFFAPPPPPAPPPRKKKGSPLPLVAGGLVVAAGLAAGAYFVFMPKQTDVASTEREREPAPILPPAATGRIADPPKQPDDAVLKDLAKDFDAVLKAMKLPDMAAALGKMYKPGVGPDKEVVPKKRTEFITAWIDDYKRVVKLAGDPTKRLEAGAEIATLQKTLKDLIEKTPSTDPAQLAKEKQCLDTVSALATQFAAPRSSP